MNKKTLFWTVLSVAIAFMTLILTWLQLFKNSGNSIENNNSPGSINIITKDIQIINPPKPDPAFDIKNISGSELENGEYQIVFDLNLKSQEIIPFLSLHVATADNTIIKNVFFRGGFLQKMSGSDTNVVLSLDNLEGGNYPVAILLAKKPTSPPNLDINFY